MHISFNVPFNALSVEILNKEGQWPVLAFALLFLQRRLQFTIFVLHRTHRIRLIYLQANMFNVGLLLTDLIWSATFTILVLKKKLHIWIETPENSILSPLSFFAQICLKLTLEVNMPHHFTSRSCSPRYEQSESKQIKSF